LSELNIIGVMSIFMNSVALWKKTKIYVE